MEIKTIENRGDWDGFLRQASPHSFLQTWEWGEFNRLRGATIFRLGLYEAGLEGICFALVVKARRGSFLFVPHGPVFKNFDGPKFTIVINYLRKLAKEHRADFLRISPGQAEDEKLARLFKAQNFRAAPIHMHAELMWLLDIRPAEAELLSAMRKNCRLAIRKAEKSSVNVTISKDPADLKHFIRLYEETARRQHFVPFSSEYLRREFEIFRKTDSAEIFLGAVNDQVRCAALVIFTSSEAFYHQGASKHADPVPVSHLVQWEIIREAKRRGCEYYNFWGVSSENLPKHPWAGLSYFKRGFGGFEYQLLHARDLPLNWLYWPVFLLETFRRIKRGL